MANHKRAAALFLALCILLLSACSGAAPKNQNANENKDDGKASPENTPEAADSRQNAKDSLPDNLDFGGADIRILNRSSAVSYTTGYMREMEAEVDSGDVVEDAIYKRNRSVEGRLGINIVSIEIPGGWDEQATFLNALRNSVSAGADDYDFVAAYSYYITPVALDGLLYNLKTVDYLSPAQPWWSESCADEMTVDGKLYFIAGDLAISLLKNMYVTFFNKQLAQDLSMENLYQLVLNGGFTMEKLKELTRDTWRDLNGDGKPDKGDAFGYAITTGTYLDAMFATLDNPITTKNEHGIPELSINNPKTAQIVENLYGLLYDNANNSYAVPEAQNHIDDIMAMFPENRVLFMPGTLATNEELRAMNSDYGIIPYPKFDKDQKDYYTASQDSFSIFSIPVTNTRLEATAAAMEALCAESYRKVTPAYYEIALKKKYARDDESSQMIDIIRDGLKFNFGFLNSMSIGPFIAGMFRDLMQAKSTDFASYYDKKAPKFEKDLEKLIAAYEKLPG
ncbi:MAG: hypothetical protein FWD23_00875 [Oscillospiraceae bacterium]|nr:hypothetical protein [Oscillospiraceae bacterium]